MAVNYSGTHATPRMELGVAVMEYVEQQDEFIGTKALPIFRTAKDASVYSAITRESYLRDADVRHAPRAAYNRDSIDAKDKTYKCQENALESVVSDSERAMYASDFDAMLVASKATARKVMQAQEKRIADALFNTSTFTGAALFTDNSASGKKWATAANDVIGQVREAAQKVRVNTGVLANTLILSQTALNQIKANTAILDAIKYVAQANDATITAALAGLFGLNKVLVAKGVRNSANEGAAFSGADIWSSSYAMVCVSAPDGQDLSQPSIGRTFLWVADSPDNTTVESYRDETVRGEVVRVRQYTDENIADAYFGHLMKIA